MADGVSVYTNAKVVAAQLSATGRIAGVRAAAITRHNGMLMLTKIKANASGRPGPRAITGDYRRSWTMEMEHVRRADLGGGGTVSVIVGTTKPQGPRLEKGFVGVDALGRHVAAPPYPHAGPALDARAPIFEHEIAMLGTFLA